MCILRDKRMVLILCLCVPVLASAPAGAELLTFSQMDFNLEGNLFPNSDWGRLDFTFTGYDTIKYLNLTVNGSWQIQNVPLISTVGEGVDQHMICGFSLGNLPGVDVTSLNYGYAVTDGVLTSEPASTIPASVGNYQVSMWSGPPGSTGMAQAVPLVGAAATDSLIHWHMGETFPNQKAGVNECVPAAVSNSLQYLNTVKGLDMFTYQMSIATMKTATGWGATGAPLYTWWSNKNSYMQSHGYNITTRRETDISKLAAEIDANQDVEIDEAWPVWLPIDPNYHPPYDPNNYDPNCPHDANWVLTTAAHCMALNGIIPLSGGRYLLNVIDDVNQKGVGGNDPDGRCLIYNNGKLSDLWGTPEGATFYDAIIECPEPTTLALLALAGAALQARRRR